MSSLFDTHCCLSEFADKGPTIKFISQVAPKPLGNTCRVIGDAVMWSEYNTDSRFVFESAYEPQAKSAPRLEGACKRSFFCEALSTDQGMCFGANGLYTYIYMFKIQDAQARGGLRQLCLSFASPSEDLIITHLLLLKEFFGGMAQLLESRAKQTFQGETPSIPSGAVRAARFAYGRKKPPAYNPSGSLALRDLSALLGKDVYVQLHHQFCRVLRAVAPAPVPIMGWKEKLLFKLEPLLQSLKSSKPLTGCEQAVSIQVRLCQQNRNDSGLDRFLYNSATPSQQRTTPGPEHGVEGDLIADRLLAQMMFGTMPMNFPVGSMKVYCIDQT